MVQERVIPIPGHPGYFVSDLGRVFSAWTGSGRGSRIGDNPHPLRQMTSADGRAQVNLRRRTYRVSNLVLLAFVGPRPDGMQACHFPDPDPANNRLSNLRWDTASANQGHDRRVHGTSNDGERNGSAKLSIPQVRAIRRRLAAGDTQRSIAADFAVSRTAIQQIGAGSRWKAVA